MKATVFVERVALQHDRVAASIFPGTGPDGEETAGHVSVVVDVVDDLPLAQAAVAGQRHAARADATQRQRHGAQRLAPVRQRFADGGRLSFVVDSWRNR